jgi:hypothetical protein
MATEPARSGVTDQHAIAPDARRLRALSPCRDDRRALAAQTAAVTARDRA